MSAPKCRRYGAESEIPICGYCDDELAIPSTKTMGNDINGYGPLLCLLVVISSAVVIIAMALCALYFLSPAK